MEVKQGDYITLIGDRKGYVTHFDPYIGFYWDETTNRRTPFIQEDVTGVDNSDQIPNNITRGTCVVLREVFRSPEYYLNQGNNSTIKTGITMEVLSNPHDLYVNCIWNGRTSGYALSKFELRLATQEESDAYFAEKTRLAEEKIKAEIAALEAKRKAEAELFGVIETECLAAFGEDNFEITRNKTLQDHDGRKGDYPNTVMIRFPEFEITNSNGGKHTIRDLYVRMYFTNEGKFFPALYGNRTTYTVSEYVSNYRHSHLNNGIFDNLSAFCLGDGPIRDVIDRLSMSWSKDDFGILIYMLDSYVRWESLEGGPYAKIAGIRNASTRLPSVTQKDITDTYEAFIAAYDTFPVEFDRNGDSFVVNARNSTFKKQVTAVATVKVGNLQGSTTNYALSGTTNGIEEAKRIEDNISPDFLRFDFKDQPLRVKILPDEDGLSNLIEVAHPDLIAQLASKLGRELTDHVMGMQLEERYALSK